MGAPIDLAQDCTEVKGDIRVRVNEWYRQDRQWVTKGNRPDLDQRTAIGTAEEGVVGGRGEGTGKLRANPSAQEVNFQQVDIAGEEFLPLLFVGISPVRAGAFVGGGEQFNGGNQGLLKHRADFNPGIPGGHGDRDRNGEWGRGDGSGWCAGIGRLVAKHADIGHEHLADGCNFNTFECEVGGDERDIVWSELFLKGITHCSNQCCVYIRQQCRQFEVGIHTGERQFHNGLQESNYQHDTIRLR
jgi:hypothetical protein